MNLDSLFTDILSKLMKPLPQKIALAVSGGVDSLALLFLASNFRINNNIDFTVITVDHDLREDSAKEAQYVEKISRDLGIKHVTLKWHREKNDSTMHAASREARYNLMTNYCLDQGIDTILTAHHADDKIESFFIRLSKASGLFGLSPSESNIYNKVRILRPLSNIYKKDLTEYITSLGISYFDDPSNYDSKYQRSNIRKWIDLMPEELEPELFKSRIIQSLAHIKESADYMRGIFTGALEKRVVIHESGYASYIFNEKYSYIEFMILSHLLTTISGYDFTPRANSIEILYNKLNSKEDVKSTLHGCIIVRKNKEITIYRCFGKNPPLDALLDKNIKWDNRWRSKIDDPNLMVGNLSMDDYINLKKDESFISMVKKINHNILFTIPVIFEKNILGIKMKKIIAIPHIGYYNDFRYGKDVLIFEPNYTSRLIHFC